ncbi:MAG: glycoside hydrolase family 1 protein [Anaerorhabdus sp.]
MKSLLIPKKLLMGSATAATQIEGGDKNSNWYTWSSNGKIAGNGSSIVAADHYNRYVEDIDIMQQLNHEIYRMSIEWSRIEPERGVYSTEGIEHYKNEIKLLKSKGIKVLVTLHHFSHPQWFEELGQWTSNESVLLFSKFVKKIVFELKDLVNEYCTINEPNVFVNDSFMDGKYPPGFKNDSFSYFKAAKNMIVAHLKCYGIIHDVRKKLGFNDTKVGIAIHLVQFDSDLDNWKVNLSKKFMNYSFHTMFLEGMISGKLPPFFGINLFKKGKYCDFIGINYYSRHIVFPSNNPATFFGEIKFEQSLSEEDVNDLGWEIYPEGIYKVVKKTYEKYKLPIYITENGIPDKDDKKRSKFIYSHLVQICKLIEEGIDVQRYYHWSLLDNLEWNDGYFPRFGLVKVDYDTLKRTIRDSGLFYGEIIKNKEITTEMIEKYINKGANNED